MFKFIQRLYWEALWWWKFRIKGSVNPEALLPPPPSGVHQTQRRQAADKRIVQRWLNEVEMDMEQSSIIQRIDEPWDQDGGYASLELMETLPSRKDEIRIDPTPPDSPNWRDGAPTVQEQLFQRSLGQ